MRVAIVGGGYTGLTAGYELARGGHEVEIFEMAQALGGQARTFPVAQTCLEAFYHHLFLSDRDILSLAEELGLAHRIAWIPSKVGVLYGGRIYPFSTPLDLLRFRPLAPWNRLRLGLVILYLQHTRNWRAFERTTADAWIPRWAGRQAYEVLWRSLLSGKFGDAYRRVSMAWFWGKVFLRGGSRRGLGPERLGYPQGSFQVLTDALADRIRLHGGRIRTGVPVRRVQIEEGRARALLLGDGTQAGPFDAVVATVPSPAFLEMVPELPEAYARLVAEVRYQVALCLVLQLRRPLSHIYWLNISDPESPFVGAIEHTNYIPPETYGGRHLLYLTNYLAPGHPYLGCTKEELLAHYLPGIRRINPAFTPEWVEALWLFQDPGAQPVVTPNDSQRIPPHRTPIPGLYLANTTQIYPEDRGTNYSVRLGRKIAREIAPA